jgi:hypothetical protein
MKFFFKLFVKHVIVSPNPWVVGLGVALILNQIQQHIPLLGPVPVPVPVPIPIPAQVPQVAHGVGAGNPNVNAPHAEQEQPQGQEQINNFENFNAFHNNYNVFEYLR